MKKIIHRILILSALFLISLIVNKYNSSSFFSKTYLKNILSENINFLKLADVYNGVFNKFIDVDKEEQTSFSLSDIIKKEEYENGINIYTNQEVVSSFEDGIVINKGKNKILGNYVIIQSANDRKTTYGNLIDVNVKLYDYIKKDDIIGSAIKKEEGYCFYICMKKDEYLDVINIIR